jgi:hypothetical protein
MDRILECLPSKGETRPEGPKLRRPGRKAGIKNNHTIEMRRRRGIEAIRVGLNSAAFPRPVG